jgi:tRNA threonylcarbamoyladenosine biosynthesis protein TsaE
MEWTFTLGEIQETAKEFWSYVGSKSVIAFYGGMGAGKTTFIKSLCAEINVQDVVSSPTFSIINEYESPVGKVYHMDLYRLNGQEEALRAGVEDCLYSGSTCLVEWPERAPGIFPDHTIPVYLDVITEEIRRIRIGDN